MNRMLLGWVGCAALFILVAAQSGYAAAQAAEAAPREEVAAAWADFAPTFESRECWFGGVEDDTGAAIVCGVVKVPEDRTDPESGLIDIAVMTIDADKHHSTTGPLVWLDSGPGWASISPARAKSAIDGRLSKLRRATGIVFFDQRGTGYSERNFCRTVPDAFTYGVPVEPDGEALFFRNMRACLDEARASGIPISAYSDWQIALDARDVRKALNIETWNVFGYLTSNGIAQAILQVDPGGVRAAIMDSPGPTERGYSDAASLAMDQALRSLSELCAAAEGCEARNGDLHGRVLAILDDYERAPLVVEGLNPKAATDGRLIFDDKIAANFLMFTIYGSSRHGDLPAVLDVLEDRDKDAMRVYAEAWFQPETGRNSQAVRFAIKCRNDAGGLGTPPETLAAAREQAPGIERRLGLFRYADDCVALDIGGPDPSAIPTEFDGPVLIADGALNPVQRPYVSKEAASRFPAAQYVLFEHGGVMPLSTQFDDCGGRLMLEFLANPDRPLNADCAANNPPPDFLMNYRRTSKPGRLLMKAQSGDYPVLLIIILLGVIGGLLVMPVRWIVKKSRTGGAAIRRAELTGWIAIIFSVAAMALFTVTLMRWVGEHQAAVPAGLPSSIVYSLALAVLAGVLAILALTFAWRSRSQLTKTSIVLTAVCAGASFASLLWLLSML